MPHCPRCGEAVLVERVETGAKADYVCAVCAWTWPVSNWMQATTLPKA